MDELKVRCLGGEWWLATKGANSVLQKIKGPFGTRLIAQNHLNWSDDLRVPMRRVPANKSILLEPKETDRPRHVKKTCTHCGTPDLVWEEHPEFGWKLYDKVLNDYHNCLGATTTTEFDPCPQCGTAFCKCANVTTEEEENDGPTL